MFFNRLYISRLLVNETKKISKTQVRNAFYEPFKSGDKKYEEQRNKELDELTEWDKISGGFSVLKQELKLYAEELKNNYSLSASLNIYDDKEIVKFWDFNQKNNSIISSVNNNEKDMNDMNRWRTLCDSDWNEGYSKCSWTVSPSGRALFSGHLDTKLPLDGRIVRAGYAFIGCEKARKSFFRQSYFDWLGMTHLLLRVRGDGRNWFILLNTSDDSSDITWFDRYQYALYTHGGPYWQFVKIPFSRFYMQSKGSAQDYQPPISLQHISQIGFLLADQNTGPFSLEIDYVGAMSDEDHDEVSVYESYYHKENPWKSPGTT